MAGDTPELVPFSPFWTQRFEGGSLILDRNLAAIKAAIDQANATIIRQQNIINQLVLSISVGGFGSTTQGLPGRDGVDGIDGSDSFVPGPPGAQGRDGRPGFGMDGSDGEDGMAGPPGAAGAAGSAGAPGAPGANGISNVPGPQGDSGEDGGDSGARMDFSGLPLGAMPTEFDTTGDVMRSPNGDSRIRGQDGIYYYSRVVVGPYNAQFGVLTIEDNAVLMVL